MANTEWNKLNRLQLGKYAEYYAKMEFASYGLDVYTSEVDDHGIDFIVKDKRGIFNEIQVKSLRDKGYTFMQQEKFNLNNKELYLVLMIFEEDRIPNIYLISTKAWNNKNNMFIIRNFDKGQKSKPEYGVNITNSNKEELEKYKFEYIIENFM
jgi:hypothetical protein